MARVQSQKVRQAVLVTGDPVDPNMLPEKLQLFNELGEPLMMGGGFARHEEVDTTAVMIPGQIQARDLELYPSVRIFKIGTNRPARVRMYPTAAMRDADLLRPIGTKPPSSSNHGRLLEVVTGAGLLELVLSPAVDLTSVDAFDALFYVSVTNLGDTDGAVAVTYHYFRTE
jgi:hypothetical protein